jgi:Fe-S-cluster-containing dehydrogenase component
MEKRVHVIDNSLCSGCRNCEVWCSLGKKTKDEFNPKNGAIRIWKDPEGVINVPAVDCAAEECGLNEHGDPICVEMCPTGVLIFTDLQDLIGKRTLYRAKRKEQPLFRLIVPWKYPYPTSKWVDQEDE